MRTVALGAASWLPWSCHDPVLLGFVSRNALRHAVITQFLSRSSERCALTLHEGHRVGRVGECVAAGAGRVEVHLEVPVRAGVVAVAADVADERARGDGRDYVHKWLADHVAVPGLHVAGVQDVHIPPVAAETWLA